MRISRCLFLLPLLAVSSALGQGDPLPSAEVKGRGAPSSDPDVSLPELIRIQVEFIELPQEKLTALLADTDAADGNGLRTKLQPLIEKKDARITDRQLATGTGGRKIVLESISELIYPTEYEPPDWPAQTEKNPAAPKGVSAYTPTAFETRKLGSRLELEPQIRGDGNSVALRIAPEITSYSGNDVWNEVKDEPGNVTKAQSPRFYCNSIDTSIICKKGESTLCASFSPKDQDNEPDPDRKRLMFVRCDVIIIK